MPWWRRCCFCNRSQAKHEALERFFDAARRVDLREMLVNPEKEEGFAHLLKVVPTFPVELLEAVSAGTVEVGLAVEVVSEVAQWEHQCLRVASQPGMVRWLSGLALSYAGAFDALVNMADMHDCAKLMVAPGTGEDLVAVLQTALQPSSNVEQQRKAACLVVLNLSYTTLDELRGPLPNVMQAPDTLAFVVQAMKDHDQDWFVVRNLGRAVAVLAGGPLGEMSPEKEALVRGIPLRVVQHTVTWLEACLDDPENCPLSWVFEPLFTIRALAWVRENELVKCGAHVQVHRALHLALLNDDHMAGSIAWNTFKVLCESDELGGRDPSMRDGMLATARALLREHGIEPTSAQARVERPEEDSMRQPLLR